MTATRHERRRLYRRRWIVVGALAAAATVLVVLVAGLGTTGEPGRPDASRPATTAAPEAVSTSLAPTTTRPPAVGHTYAVGTHTDTFVDPSRATSPNGAFAGASTRTLPTQLWYPATGGGGPDAPADRSGGRYPLVVFSHGYDVTPSFYAPLLERWAAAGYVVAAPTYPILSGNDGGPSHVDYTQTFADTSFVITRVLALAAPDPVAGLVDATRIAAAGHSDGEVVAYGLGRLACCRDPRVRAVVAMAGNLANANNPAAPDAATPILHVMETGDEFDPYPASIAWDRANLAAPRYLLTLTGATHVPPYTQPGNPAFGLVSTVTLDFLDGYLKDASDRLDRIAGDVAAASRLATLER